MKKYIICFIFSILSLSLFTSCLVEPKFPYEPKISFNDIKYVKGSPDTIWVAINFQDGDGDLGLGDDKPNDFNYFQDLYIQNASGEFELYTFQGSAVNFDGRFPVLNTGKAKPLEGTIKWYKTVSAAFKGEISNKVIKFKIHIEDQAGHKSDSIFTGNLTVPKLL